MIMNRFLQLFARSKCTKDCSKCPLLFSCMDKKAILRPFPAWLWGIGLGSLALPSIVAYKAGDLPLVPLLAGDEFIRYIEDNLPNI